MYDSLLTYLLTAAPHLKGRNDDFIGPDVPNIHLKYLYRFHLNDVCEIEIFNVVVVLMFYGPSTLFRSFRARSVNLSTLFLGTSPRQFTST